MAFRGIECAYILLKRKLNPYTRTRMSEEIHGWTSGPCPFCKKPVDMTHYKYIAKDGTVYGKANCPNCNEVISYEMAANYAKRDL